MFPKFYADIAIDSAPNSKEANILRAHDPKIIEKVKSNMAIATCTHIKVTGVRCESPALRGHEFCYFHQRVHRGVRTPPQARLHPIAVIEDEESIQASLMEVINALMRNTIDLKRAELILRALHIAVRNARRVKFHAYSSDAVREIPEYAAPNTSSAEKAEIAEAMKIPPHNSSGQRPGYIRTAAELIRDGVVQPRHAAPATLKKERANMIAEYFGYPNAEAHAAALAAKEAETKRVERPPTPANPNPNAASNVVGTPSPANVGADAPVRPGPAKPVRESARTDKKPPLSTKTAAPPDRSKSHRVSAG